MHQHLSRRRSTDLSPVIEQDTIAEPPRLDHPGAGSGHDFAQIAVQPDQAFRTATSGQPQPVPYRDEMEAAFDQDFSEVRTYLGDTPAVQGLDQLNAHAATHGEQIAFASPQPSQELVAHELTHVVQQHDAPTGQLVGNGYLTAESEARQVGSRVGSGQPAGTVSATGAGIQLEDKGTTLDPKTLGTSPTLGSATNNKGQLIRGFEDQIGGPPPPVSQQAQAFGTLQSVIDQFHASANKFAQQAEANRAMTTYLNMRPNILDTLYQNPGFGAGITINFLVKIPPQNPAVPFSPVATFQGITYSLIWDTGNINADNITAQSGKAQTIDVARNGSGVVPERISPEGYRFQSVTLWEPAPRSQAGTAAKPGSALEVSTADVFWRIARAENLGTVRIQHALTHGALESMMLVTVQLGGTKVAISTGLQSALLAYYNVAAEAVVKKNLDAYKADVDALQNRLHRVCAKGVSWWEQLGGKTPPDPHMMDGSHFQVWAAGDHLKNKRYLDAWKAIDFGWLRNENAAKAIAEYE